MQKVHRAGNTGSAKCNKKEVEVALDGDQVRRKLRDNKKSLVLMNEVPRRASEILEGVRPSEVCVCVAGCVCMCAHACMFPFLADKNIT